MDGYPSAYIDNHYPLLIVSGLEAVDQKPIGTEDAVLFSGESSLVESKQPALETPDASRLLRYLQKSSQGKNAPTAANTGERLGFNIISVGRVCTSQAYSRLIE
jgi:hypothetical protein